MSQHHAMYVTTRWKKLRMWHLTRNPLCVRCTEEGLITPGNTVDHILPHRGDWDMFCLPTNLQTLCPPHHSSDKQREERAELDQVPMCDEDGFPTTGDW